MSSSPTATIERPPRTLSALTLGARLLTLDFKRQLFSRKALVNIVIQLLPVLIGLVAITTQGLDGTTLFRNLISNVYLPLLIPLTALFFGGPTVINEIEGRTITYLTLRPLPRAILYLAKFGASLLTTLLITVIPIVLLAAVCMIGASEPLGDLLPLFAGGIGAAALGAIAYTAIFAALAVLFYATLLPGIVYFVVVEMVFAAIPILELLSVRFHMRTIAGLQQERGFLAGLIADEPLAFEWWVGVLIAAFFAIAATAVATVVFRQRQFHV